MPLTPTVLSTADLHLWQPGCHPGPPAPRVTQHSPTGKIHQVAFPNCTSQQHAAPSGQEALCCPTLRPPTLRGRGHRSPAHAQLSTHCSQHTARLIRLSAALAREAENRWISCPRWAPVQWTGINAPQRDSAYPHPLQTARDWQGGQERGVYMSHEWLKVIKAPKSTGIHCHSSTVQLLFLKLIPWWGSPPKGNPSSCSLEELWIFGCLFYQWETIPETQDANINSETAVLTYRYHEKQT